MLKIAKGCKAALRKQGGFLCLIFTLGSVDLLNFIQLSERRLAGRENPVYFINN